jgi:hypothetical protein
MIRANDEQLRQLLLGQQQVLQETYEILGTEQRKDDVLAAVVLSSRGHHPNRIARLDPTRVYSLEALEAMCVQYRLRFLDAGRFKGNLSPRAIYELRHLEYRSEAPLKGFKIMAPAVGFKRPKTDLDPLLFVGVGAEHYYLVHKGKLDITPWRAVMAWPFRSPWQLAAVVLVLAGALSLLVPNAWMGSLSPEHWGGYRLTALLFSSMVLASITSFCWFTFGGKFSREVWNDHRSR